MGVGMSGDVSQMRSVFRKVLNEQRDAPKENITAEGGWAPLVG